MTGPGLAAIRDAAARCAPFIHTTPVATSCSLDTLLGARLYFKCENLQKTGSFKIRGATNAVFSLTEAQLRLGVATHSSGNHGAALAQAARWRGIPATVVMPGTAPLPKRRAVAGYGAEIVPCAATLAARQQTLEALTARSGAVFIPPYDDPRIIAGQATVALELLDQVPGLEVLVAPVGGGGLLSGVALCTHHLRPGLQVMGAEPALADDACRSLAAGRRLPAGPPRSMADGLLTSLGRLPFAIIRRHVQTIVTVSEVQIAAAMGLIWERLKLVVEPSGAVALAAVMARPGAFAHRRVGIILSGGNVDLERLPFTHPCPV
jgi:threonine dehydratase